MVGKLDGVFLSMQACIRGYSTYKRLRDILKETLRDSCWKFKAWLFTCLLLMYSSSVITKYTWRGQLSILLDSQRSLGEVLVDTYINRNLYCISLKFHQGAISLFDQYQRCEEDYLEMVIGVPRRIR